MVKSMLDPCCVHGLVLSCSSKQNVLSLIILIPLAKLTNQKKGICRHCILYPLRLEPPFPNDARILKPNVGLGPDQMKINLKKVFMENITNFGKKKGHENPRACVHIHAYAHTCSSSACAYFMHAYAYTCMRVRAHKDSLENSESKRGFFYKTSLSQV